MTDHLFDPDTTASLFYDLDSLPTTPLDQLDLPRETRWIEHEIVCLDCARGTLHDCPTNRKDPTP